MSKAKSHKHDKSHVQETGGEGAGAQSFGEDLLNQTVSAFIAYVKEDVTEMKKSMNSLITENMELRKQATAMENRLHLTENLVVLLQNKVSAQHEEILDLKCRSMRDNLVFHGIPEADNESWSDTKHKVTAFIKDVMKMPPAEVDSLSIDRAHRMGAKGARHRPVVVRFLTSESRSNIFKYVRNLQQHKDVSIQEQFPPEVSERRKRLLPLQKEAKRDKKKVHWAVDKLVIDGKYHSAEDDSCSVVPGDLHFDANIVHTGHVKTDGSTFIGHATLLKKKEDIPEVMGTLLQDRALTSATHNSYAYRIKKGNSIVEGCKDDQEHGAGSTLLNQLREMNEVNIITIVSRWCGSKLMGPRSWDGYKDCAKSAIEQLR